MSEDMKIGLHLNTVYVQEGEHMNGDAMPDPTPLANIQQAVTPRLTQVLEIPDGLTQP